MAFERVVRPERWTTGDELTGALVGIGCNLAAAPLSEPNFEDTLLSASIEGMDRHDLRVLDLLVTWLEVHHAHVNADRLIRAASTLESDRAKAFWAAVGRWLEADRRFARLVGIYTGPRVDGLPGRSTYSLQQKGEDPDFLDTPIRIPDGTLPCRRSDVLPPTELARRHRAYHYRVLMGPSYRADMWAALERTPDLSCAELARATYGSFATAWQVKADWELLAA